MTIPLGNHPLHTRGLGGTFAPVKVPGVINRLTPSCPWSPDFFGVTANIYSDLYADELDHVATNLDRLHGTAANQATGQEPDIKKRP